MRQIKQIQNIKIKIEPTFFSLDWNFNGSIITLVSLIKDNYYVNFLNSKGILYQNYSIRDCDYITYTKWSYDENFIAIGFGNGKLIISNLLELNSILLHKAGIVCLSWLNCHCLMSGDKTGKCIVWKSQNLKLTFLMEYNLNKEIINIYSLNTSKNQSTNQFDSIILIIITKANINVCQSGIVQECVAVQENIIKAYLNESKTELYIITKSLNIMKFAVSPINLIYETKLSGHFKTLTTTRIENHIMGFATGDHTLKFLDMKSNSFDTLGLSKDLWENDDTFLALDYDKAQKNLAAGTYTGAIYIWHTHLTDSIKNIKWQLVHYVHNHTLIKELKWQPKHDSPKLLVLSPRKVCLLEDVWLPIFCDTKEKRVIAPLSTHELLIESVTGPSLQVLAKPIKLKQASQIRGYTYASGFVITWDDEKIYLYSLGNQTTTTVKTLGTCPFPPDASYLCHTCAIWGTEIAFANFHISNTDPTDITNPETTDCSEFKTSTLYTWLLKEFSPILMPFLKLNSDLGAGQIESFAITHNILSICSSTNHFIAYRLNGKTTKIFKQPNQPSPDIIKGFTSFRNESWNLVQALNNADSTLYIMLFRKKLARQINVIIMWDKANDIIFPVDLDPLQMYSPFPSIKNQYWDESYPNMFAVTLEKTNIDVKIRGTAVSEDNIPCVLVYLVSSENGISLFDRIPMPNNQQHELVKMHFPHLIYGRRMTPNLENENNGLTKGEFQSVIIYPFPIFDIPIGKPIEHDGYQLVNLNFLKADINLSPSEISEILNIFFDYIFKRWTVLLQSFDSIKRYESFGYLTHFFLLKKDLKLALACAQAYFGNVKFTILESLLKDHLPSILSPVMKCEKGVPDDVKISACYVYMGLRDEFIYMDLIGLADTIKAFSFWEKGMESLNEISTKGDYELRDMCRRLIMRWSDGGALDELRPNDTNIPNSLADRIDSNAYDIELKKTFYEDIPDSMSDHQKRVQDLLSLAFSSSSTSTTLRDLTDLLTANSDIEDTCNTVIALTAKMGDGSGKLVSKNSSKLYQWLGQYLEAKSLYAKALHFYERAPDDLSIVKMYCKLGQLREATSYAKEHDNCATYFYLGQEYEKGGEYLESIKYFMSAKAFSIAFNLCKTNNLENELFELSANFPTDHKGEIAKYYERAGGQEEKAEILYQNVGNLDKALRMALKTSNVASLNRLVEGVDTHMDAELLDEIIERFVGNNQIERALKLYIKVNRYREAITLCLEKHTNTVETVALGLLERANQSKANMEKIIALNRGDGSISRLAECATKVGNHQIACQIYAALLGDKMQAMKSLIRTRNKEKIIQFVQISRNVDIFIMAANHLQTTDGWRKDPILFKFIADLYTKSKAYTPLLEFFEACAQNSIEENDDYAQALTFLHQASKVLSKIVESTGNTSAASVKALEHRLQLEMEMIRSYLKAQKCLKENNESVMGICNELLNQIKLTVNKSLKVTVKPYHIKAITVMYLIKNGRIDEAKKIADELQASFLDIGKILGKDVIKALKI